MAPFTWFKRTPGLTQDQNNRQAQRLQQAAMKQERKVEVEMPGDVTVNQQMTLTLAGTETAFDQQYDIESVEHHFDANTGYRMTITAKNTSAGNTGYAPGSGDNPSSPSNPGQQPSNQGFTPFTPYAGFPDNTVAPSGGSGNTGLP